MPYDATDAFRGIFAQYPNQTGLYRAASAWQAIVESGFPGGEAALSAVIQARIDGGQIARHPYKGDARHRPMFETYLKEFRWEDPESAPDDDEPPRGPNGPVTGLREYQG